MAISTLTVTYGTTRRPRKSFVMPSIAQSAELRGKWRVKSMSTNLIDEKTLLDTLSRAKQWAEHSEHYYPELVDDLNKAITLFEKHPINADIDQELAKAAYQTEDNSA